MNPVQLEIDVSPYAPAESGSDTSRAAAVAIAPHLNRLESKVLMYFMLPGFPDWTCDEIEATSGLLHTTTSARLRRLCQLGKICDSGKRRLTRSGRGATVYRLA